MSESRTIENRDNFSVKTSCQLRPSINIPWAYPLFEASPDSWLGPVHVDCLSPLLVIAKGTRFLKVRCVGWVGSSVRRWLSSPLFSKTLFIKRLRNPNEHVHSWPSGLRRYVQVVFLVGVGSNPTECTFCSQGKTAIWHSTTYQQLHKSRKTIL